MQFNRNNKCLRHLIDYRIFCSLSIILVLLSGCQTTPSDTVKSFAVNKDGTNLKITEKVEPAIKFFSVQKTMSADDLKERARGILEKVGTVVAKNPKLDKAGPATLIYQDLISMPDSAITADIGFPVRGYAKVNGQYSLITKPEFKYLSLVHSSNKKDPKGNWLFLYDVAEKKGYQLSGEARTVATFSVAAGGKKIELQLGVK
ncbi:MAG: hypothetical protein CSA50_05575 [Gammaproteobacteria bacterium]|nr:MAG: hypothetical protein CSA50_05575 [Gammaproteobacteria bacterium]